jgi:putative ABC transport system ATP-binding protein
MADAHTTLLTARGLSVTLRGDHGDVRVVDAVDFDLASGEIIDVVGRSGAGKTTLLRALARLMPGATGELQLAGTPAERLSPQHWRARIALLPQKPAILPGAVRENLVLPWTFKVRTQAALPADDALRERMDHFGLADVALTRDADRLSVGQQARVALLRVLLTQPEVLLLDEPDANLDDESADTVALATAEFATDGGGVVRVRHQRADALASRRLTLCDGALCEVTS